MRSGGALAAVLADETLASDARFADRASRWRNRRALDDIIAGWTRTVTPQQAMELLQAAGVAAMPVMNIADQFADPHLNAREPTLRLTIPT